MQDFEALFIAKVPSFERTVFWMYLDTHAPPIVTVGTGFAISLDEAVTIHFLVDGKPATRDQIIYAYNRVHCMPGAMLADHYKYVSCPVIDKDENDRLLFERVAMFVAELKHVFPTFDSFPTTVKAALLEMIYTLGTAGLRAYHILIPAVERRDWKICSEQCGRNVSNKAYNARNQWTRLLFLEALKG